MRSATTTVLLLLLLLLLLPGNFLLSAAAFSEESLKDLSRLPHFQRIWLQRLDQSNRRNSNNSINSAKVTTSSARPSSSTSTWTDPSTTDESLEEVVDGDERVTTVGPTTVVGRNSDSAGMESTSGKVTLTISEAKERLKARRIKSRKVKTVMQQPKEEEEEQPNNQGHYQYNKKADNIFRDEKEEAVEVKKHIQRMAGAGCSTPALRLIYVRQQHEASPNVRYLPACTWLHRCSDEIGCCTDDSKTCSASHIESVSLPFFVLTMTGSETKRTVTRLSFENHTACECVGRNSDLMPRTEPYSSSSSSDPVIRKSRLSSPLLYNHDEGNNSDEGKSSRHHENVSKNSKTKKGRRHDDPPSSSSLQLGRVATAYSPDPALLFHRRNEDEDSAGAKRRFSGASPGSNYSNSSSSNVSKCRCPSGFTPVANSRKRSACGLCQCHDYDFGRSRHHHGGIRAANPATTRHHHHQNLCGRLKRGLETFSPRDRGCIVEKKCGTPECSYGRYVTLAGRCPRRHELRPRS